jgi:hypothetical protein
MHKGWLSRSQSVRWPGSDSRLPQTTAPHQLRAGSVRNMQRPMIVPSPATASGGTQLNLRQPPRLLQRPLQRQLSASSTNDSVAECCEERQIINKSVGSTDTALSSTSTPRALPRQVSTDGNGVTLFRQSNDGDIIHKRMISKEEWNGVPHAHQNSNDDRNKLGRDKLAARRKRRLNGLKQVGFRV